MEERVRREIKRLEGTLEAIERYEFLAQGRVTHIKKQVKASIESLKRVLEG